MTKRKFPKYIFVEFKISLVFVWKERANNLIKFKIVNFGFDLFAKKLIMIFPFFFSLQFITMTSINWFITLHHQIHIYIYLTQSSLQHKPAERFTHRLKEYIKVKTKATEYSRKNPHKPQSIMDIRN